MYMFNKIRTRVSSPQSTKPTNSAIYRLELASSEETIISLSDFIEIVGNQGCGFLPCNHNPIPFSNNDNKSLWLTVNNSTAYSFRIIGLDFDDCGITPLEVVSKFKNYHITPFFLYQTLGDKAPKNANKEQIKRFRAIILLNKCLSSNLYTNIINDYLLKIFPESDASIKNTSTMLYGGKSIIYKDEGGVMDANYFLSLYHDFVNNNKAQRKYKVFQKELISTHLSLTTQIDHFLSNDIYNYIEGDKNVSKRIKWSEQEWTFAQSKWPLLNDFLKGTVKIYHPQLYLLYLAMMHIDGGIKRWLDAVAKNPLLDFVDKQRKIDWWIKAQKKQGVKFYEPPLYKIDDNLPPNFYYYLTDIGNKQKSSIPVRIKSFKERDIKDIRANLRDIFYEEMGRKGNILLKAPTGVGKTHTLLQYLKNIGDVSGMVIAVPTHSLKDEIATKVTELGIPFEATPIEPPLPTQLGEQVQKLRRLGFHLEASSLLKNVARGVEGVIKKYGVGSEIILSLQDYYESLAEIRQANGLVITTHEMMLQSDFPNHDTLIIDEDPTFRFLKIGEISAQALKVLKNLSSNISFNAYVDEIVSFKRNAKNGITELQLPPKIDTPESFYDLEIQNLGIFFDANKVFGVIEDGVIQKVCFSKIRTLSPNFLRVAILSATANETLLCSIIGQINIKDLGYVKLEGNLLQSCRRGLSKTSVLKGDHVSVLEDIKKVVGSTPIITHKIPKLESILETKLNFNNTEGLNKFEGENLLIVGTPYPPEYMIPLIASSLNIAYKSTVVDYMTIEFDGWVFPFRTFYDENLRDIHLKYIQGALMQAVGRARLSHNDKTVVVLSKMPLPQATMLNDSFEQIPSVIQKSLKVKKERIVPIGYKIYGAVSGSAF